jgi:hypothetical protein
LAEFVRHGCRGVAMEHLKAAKKMGKGHHGW